MTTVYIGLGSNLGDGRANLLAAWRLLGEEEGISLLALSSPYTSAPVGMASAQWFTNAVGCLETSLSGHELLAILLAVEQRLGRDRQQGPDRTVDLDLLYFGKAVIDDTRLTVPHPEIANRLFVLAPLAEVAPDFKHPVLGLTTLELRRKIEASDQAVHKIHWSEEKPCPPCV